MPQVNQAGLDLIKSFEGCELTAYWDSSGGVWTIGWGHTGLEVHAGLTWTQTQADNKLVLDVQAAANVVQSLTRINLTPNQFAALTSFEYNTGGLSGSPGMMLINGRQFEKAWDEHFCLWINRGTPSEPGLVRRRAAERKLFFTP